MPLLVFLAVASALAGDIHGTVRSMDDGEPLAYALVEVVGTRLRVTADEGGRYRIPSVPAGRWTIRARSVGYAAATRAVEVTDEPLLVDLYLEPVAIGVDPLVIEGRRSPEESAANAAGAPPIRLEIEQIQAVPTPFEQDVFRAVQTMPAVAAASDYSSALYVRGGTPDQSLVLLDGMPLLNPYHVGGLFAAVDPDIIQSVDVSMGAMSAALGDRLSSVVSLRSRDPGAETRGWGSIGLLSARTGLSGPLGSGGYIVAARTTYIDWATRGAAALGLLDEGVPYGFTDGFAQIEQPLLGGDLRVSGYANREGLFFSDDFQADEQVRIDFDWTSLSAAATWTRTLGAHWDLAATFGVADFDGDFDVLPDSGRAGSEDFIRGNVGDRFLRPSIDLLYVGSPMTHRFGAAVEHYTHSYSVDTSEEQVAQFVAIGSLEDELTSLSLYGESEWQSSEATRWRLGLRALRAGSLGWALQPRFGVRHRLHEDWTLFASAGRKAQAVRSRKNEEALLSSVFAYDILGVVDPAIGIAVADEVTLGARFEPRASLRVRADVYARRARDLSVAPLPTDPFDALIVDVAVGPAASENAAGVELSAAWRSGPTQAWLSYSFSSLTREVAGHSYTPRYHRAHMLDLLASRTVGGRMTLSGRLGVGSGQPYTPAIGLMDGLVYDPESNAWEPGSTDVVLGEHNGERMPAYIRADVGMKWSFNPTIFGQRTVLTPYLNVMNAFSYSNTLFAVYEVTANGAERTFAPQLPLLPSFGVEWSF